MMIQHFLSSLEWVGINFQKHWRDEHSSTFYTTAFCFLVILPLFIHCSQAGHYFFLRIATNTSVFRALWRKTKSLWFNVKQELTFKSYCVLFSCKLITIYRGINNFSFYCLVQSLCIIHKYTKKSMKIKKATK